MLTLPTLFLAQRRKKMDVVSNIEVKILAMKPLGNNAVAKDLETFYGFGFGVNLMTPINFGIGADYSEFFSNKKNGQQPIYNNWGSPRMQVLDVFLIHRQEISEDFHLEEIGGISYNRLTNVDTDLDERQTHKVAGFVLGGKAIYTLAGPQQVFVGLKANYYGIPVANENSELQRFYEHKFSVGINAGYRFQF